MLSGASVAAQALALLVSPILTRIYVPTDFGTVAVFTALLSIAGVIGTFRLEFALTLPSDESTARCLLWFCVVLSAFACCLLFVLLYFFNNIAFSWLGAADLLEFWWILPVSVLALGSYQTFTYWAIRRQDYARIAKTKLWQSVVGSAVGIGVGLAVAGPVGLLLSTVLYQSAGSISLSRGVQKRLALGEMFQELRTGLKIAHSYLKFSLQATGATLLNSTSTFLPPLLLASLYDAETTGSFAFAQKLVSLPLALIGTATGQVFLGESSRVLRDDPDELRALLVQVTRRLLPFGGALILAGFLCPLLFPIAFGESWETSGWYAAILAIPAALQLVVSPISTVTLIRNQQKFQLFLDASRLLVVSAGLCLPYFFGCSPLVAVFCYSIGMIIIYIATFYTCRHLAGSG